MKMFKKLGALALILLTAAPVYASANSGPAHWESSPSFSITALEDCPVSVSREDLTFDFSAEQQANYSLKTMVTAAYRMANPTAKPAKVQMAFPLIASLDDLTQIKGVRISVGGKQIPFEIFLGNTMPKAEYTNNYYSQDGKLVKTSLPSFSQILGSISDKPAKLNRLKGKGKRYELSYKSGGDAKLLATFQTKGKPCAILAEGNDGFTNSGTELQLEKSLGYDNEPLSIVTFGDIGQPSAKIADYNNKPITSGKPSVKVTEQDADSYFKQVMKQSKIYQEYPSEKFLSRLTTAAEKNAEASVSGANPIFDMSNERSIFEQQRVMVLAYEVLFPANSEIEVSVNYPMSGSMNKQNTQEPIYTYGYLLNPAKGWAGFQNLNIKVIPPKSNPYVTQSSIPFSKAQDNTYTAKLSALPKNDLVFSIYSKAQSAPESTSQIVKTLLPWALVAVVVLLLTLFLVHTLKKKKI